MRVVDDNDDLNARDETGLRRCAGITKSGAACESFARPGSEHCYFHSGEVDPAAVGRAGGVASAERRSVRERFREDAERRYSQLFESLSEAINAEVTRWGDCPNCKHRVPVTFPDIRARTQAIQLLLDQGYGKPPQTIVEEPREDGLNLLRQFLLTLEGGEVDELRDVLERKLAAFSARERI
jgi:hypothetical protein